MGPREKLEHRAERAVVRIPAALIGVATTIIVQIGAGIWFASYYVANQSHLERSLGKVEVKMDALLSERLTSRDLEPIRSLIADHENRLRLMERGPRG